MSRRVLFNGGFKKFVIVSVSALVMAGCSGPNKKTKEGALGGATVGGIAGAVIGGKKGAAIGAAVGGAAGAAAGRYLDKRQDELDEVVKTEKTNDGLKVTLENDVLFDFDRASLRADAEKTLGDLADILEKYPDDKLAVIGWTDSIGSEEYNKELSEKRAEAVRGFLLNRGITGARVQAIGRGESSDKDTSEAARQQQRKVEIFIDPVLPDEGAKKGS